jgi:hypothetical protein
MNCGVAAAAIDQAGVEKRAHLTFSQSASAFSYAGTTALPHLGLWRAIRLILVNAHGRLAPAPEELIFLKVQERSPLECLFRSMVTMRQVSLWFDGTRRSIRTGQVRL